MTLFAWGNPRHFPTLPPPSRRYFDVDADSRVAADCHWQPRPREHPTIIALHGLNASSDAHYMRGLAAKAFARGLNVVRLNQRNCGDTEQLSTGLFHSGLTADAAHVIHDLTDIDGLPSISVAGYSLGGNVALKLAAEYGTHAPRTLRGVAAVSPIIEIGECQRALPVEFRQGSEAPDAQERASPSRSLRSVAARRRPDRARLRRGLHRAVLRFPERRGLLPSRQLASHHRSHLRAGFHHHGR
jgi:predicted alpha/beta-fold hydrolase